MEKQTIEKKIESLKKEMVHIDHMIELYNNKKSKNIKDQRYFKNLLEELA